MFIRETKEVNSYKRKSKYGKLSEYSRTRYILHYKCDLCDSEFTKIKNGPLKPNSKSFCRVCISEHGIAKLGGMVGYESKLKKSKEKIGTTIVRDKDNYPFVYVGKDYPYSNGRNSVRKHIFVMQERIGRKIKKGEIVHHIDGDKLNNDLENLYLTTVAEHNKLHATSENIVFDLVKSNLVKFNRDTGRYEMSETLKNIIDSSK